MTRDEVIEAIACPSCGAPAGAPCHRGRLCATRRGRAEMFHGWMEPRPAPGVVNERVKRRRASHGRAR